MTRCSLPGDWWGHETRRHWWCGGVFPWLWCPLAPGQPHRGDSSPVGPVGLGQHLLTKLHLRVLYAKPRDRRLCPAEKGLLPVQGSCLQLWVQLSTAITAPPAPPILLSVPQAAEHQPRSRHAHSSQADFAGIRWLPVLSSIACQLIFPFHPRETEGFCRKKVLWEIHSI